MSAPRFLVTGAHGCVGAWIIHELLARDLPVVGFDQSSRPARLRLLLGERADEVPHVVGDITDVDVLDRAVDEHGITNVIHLAALQVPLVRANPPLGAQVNVKGTVNVFEVAARRQLAPVVYASSIAAFDSSGTLRDHPQTLYGVFKRANESTAFVYHAEQGLASTGLRPHTVYGVGRDQGVTSAPTIAMLAAAAERQYTIPYGGTAQFQLTSDVARAFIAASLAGATEASVHNLPGPGVEITDLVSVIRRIVPDAAIDCTGAALPFPGETDSSSFAVLIPDFEPTPLEHGVRAVIGRFGELLQRGVVAPPPNPAEGPATNSAETAP